MNASTGDEFTNDVRDHLIASAPQHEGLIRTRDEVATKWCAEYGVNKDDITMSQLLRIRALPEWQNAS